MNWHKTAIPTPPLISKYDIVLVLPHKLADYLVSEREGHDDETQAEVGEGEGSDEPVLERRGHSQSQQ